MFPNWIKTLYRFFTAVTRRLVVIPSGVNPVVIAGTAGVWGAFAGASTEIAATVGTIPVRIYQIDMSDPTAAVNYEVQIGHGPAGSETWLGVVTYNQESVTLPFPMEVPAGRRLAARCRDSAGGNTVAVKVLAYTIP